LRNEIKTKNYKADKFTYPENLKNRRNSMKKNHFSIILLAVTFFIFGTVQMNASSSEKTIVETAIDAGMFNTLVTAVKTAGLVETLSGEGPFTVFAPTDDAFAKLPEGTVEALLNDVEKLTSILTYHVVAGKVMASDVVNMTSAKTVNGQSLTITVKDGNVMVDNAKVIKTDIVCSNGVIHVIDTVVLPNNK